MRGRPAFIADCGICTLAWDADCGQYDLIENDICPDHGVGGWGLEEDEEPLFEDPLRDEIGSE